MKSNQIEQKAAEYAKKHYDIPFEDDSSMNVIVSEESYVAGAHSRDTEVEMLQNQIAELSEQLKMNAENIQKLRNPLISVEDRLPEGNPDDKGYSVIVIGLFSDGSVSKCFYSIEEEIWFIGIFTTDRPNYWMPIPELKKKI